jgi:EAL domain-containing protein (putative c-di-GMP-specific phosphodiesterase class I)/DNA-binding response OmpR family regulator
MAQVDLAMNDSQPHLGPAMARVVPDPLIDAKVLVIDDQRLNVVLLERLLHSAGVREVVALTDSRLAVQRCLEVQPDLVMLDLHMPHLDGYDVLAGLQAALPAEDFLPIIVLTADVSGEARERALDAGAKDFLTKPFDRIETIQRVRNLLETRALYRVVRTHNTELREELELRKAEELHAAEHRRLVRDRIEKALRDGSLSMVFQPIADLENGQTRGVEALARFDCEPRRPPNVWFDEAAELGPELELAAVSAALDQLPRLPAAWFMSVNVSPATVLSGELSASLAGVPPSRVVLEVTEHTRVEDYEPLVNALDRLRTSGVRVAIDDAGSGYAGLQHLLRLKPDIIKLDLDLTRGIHRDPARRALARSFVAFADEIDATIVAEGIETAEDMAVLRELHVPWGQGYHLARPAPISLSLAAPPTGTSAT